MKIIFGKHRLEITMILINQLNFQQIILFINAYLEIWSPSIFPYCCVIEIIYNDVYICRLFKIDENIRVVILQDYEKDFNYAS